MLKSKKFIFILIAVNVVIWTFFVVRFFNLYNGDELKTIVQPEFKPKNGIANDTSVYILALNYDDPFLKNSPSARKIEIKQKTINTNPPIAKAPQNPSPIAQPKPEIRYLGLVKSNSSGSATAIVFLNGQSKIIRANETIGGIVFKSFNKDSLVARIGKEQIVVKR